MKKINKLLVGLIMLFVLVIFSITNSKTLANATSNLLVANSFDGYLFVGDSFTEALSKSNLITENVTYKGVIGVAANYWVSHFNEMPTSANGVMVLLGVNNPDTVSSMKSLIDKLRAKYTSAPIYVQRVFPVAENCKDTGGMSASDFNKKIDSYNSQIKSYVESLTNVYYVDTTNGYIGSDGYLKIDLATSDGLHLKDQSTWVNNMKSAINGAGGTSLIGTPYNSDFQCGTPASVCTSSGYNILCHMEAPLNEIQGITVTSKVCSSDRPNHKGIDIVPNGDNWNVNNVLEGTVINVVQYNGNCYATGCGQGQSMGNAVVVQTTGEYGGYKIYYMHLQSISADILNAWTAGSQYTLKKGELVGVMGNTGSSDGAHLHFQMINSTDQVVDLNAFFENKGSIECGGVYAEGTIVSPGGGDADTVNNVTTATQEEAGNLIAAKAEAVFADTANWCYTSPSANNAWRVSTYNGIKPRQQNGRSYYSTDCNGFVGYVVHRALGIGADKASDFTQATFGNPDSTWTPRSQFAPYFEVVKGSTSFETVMSLAKRGDIIASYGSYTGANGNHIQIFVGNNSVIGNTGGECGTVIKKDTAPNIIHYGRSATARYWTLIRIKDGWYNNK